MRKVMTARQRLQPFGNVSRLQTDEEAYGLQLVESGAVAAGNSIGAGDDSVGSADVADVEHAAGKGWMEMSDVPDWTWAGRAQNAEKAYADMRMLLIDIRLRLSQDGFHQDLVSRIDEELRPHK